MEKNVAGVTVKRRERGEIRKKLKKNINWKTKEKDEVEEDREYDETSGGRKEGQ